MLLPSGNLIECHEVIPPKRFDVFSPGLRDALNASNAGLLLLLDLLVDLNRRVAKLGISALYFVIVSGLKKNQDAPRPSEHPPVRGKNVKTFRWDHRPQIQNLLMAFKRVPLC